MDKKYDKNIKNPGKGYNLFQLDLANLQRVTGATLISASG